MIDAILTADIDAMFDALPGIEDVIIGAVICRAAISATRPGEQVGMVIDHVLTAEIPVSDLPTVSRGQVLVRGDAIRYKITEVMESDGYTWRIALSREMISI